MGGGVLAWIGSQLSTFDPQSKHFCINNDWRYSPLAAQEDKAFSELIALPGKKNYLKVD
jgi:hypothetical protein